MMTVIMVRNETAKLTERTALTVTHRVGGTSPALALLRVEDRLRGEIMNPIDALMAEHRIIERTLDALVTWATGMVSRKADERTELVPFVAFVREFVDPVHHGKEEDILFATMVEHGFSREQGPVAMMLHEHEECRSLVRALATLAQQANPWTERDMHQVARAASSYAELLGHHIQKEDQILYPMSEARLPESAKAKIAAAFVEFESHRVNPSERARLLALAEAFVDRHTRRAAG